MYIRSNTPCPDFSSPRKAHRAMWNMLVLPRYVIYVKWKLLKLILSGKINGIIGFSHVLYESTGYRMISSVLLFECYIHFRAIWRDDKWRNKSVRGGSRDARGAASDHRHSQSSGEVRIGGMLAPVEESPPSHPFHCLFTQIPKLWSGGNLVDKEEGSVWSLWRRCYRKLWKEEFRL